MREHAPQLRQDDSEPDAAIRGFCSLASGRAPPLLDRLGNGRLVWFPEAGFGYFPVRAGLAPYDREYFDRFGRQAQSEIGRKLMRARVDFVDRHYRGTACDIGIGSGAFIDARKRLGRLTYGYDVNPAGMAWLADRGLLTDPYLVPFTALTLWDVLEHIADFSRLIANAREWVFVSLPIFRDAEHVLRSKHYRRDEHFWYFTRDAFVDVMRSLGFELAEESDMEIAAGREDIGAFAFRRVA